MSGAASNGAHGESALLHQGWHQGSLITSTDLSMGFNARNASGRFEPQARKVKAKERLVIASQDCDIVAAAEPYLEALICKQEKQDFCNKVEGRSARYFVVDPPNCLVAYASHRLLIAKNDLAALSAEPWPASKVRLAAFVRWLARRYDRPPFPEQLVQAFQRPLEAVLASIDATSLETGKALSHATREWRITLPTSEQPPFHLQLLLVLSSATLSAEEADTLDEAGEQILTALDPTLVQLDPVIRKVTEDELSLRDYRATCALNLEFLTYRGDEVVGAPPLTRS